MGTLTNPGYRDAPSFGHFGTIKCVDSGDVAVATGDIDVNDVVKLFRLPKGAVIIGAVLEASDIDTNASPTVTLALGDAGDNDRYITGATIGRTGGVGQAMDAAGFGYKLTADTDINVTVTAGAATAAAGTVRALVMYYEGEVY